MNSSAVLVISTSIDAATDAVQEALGRYGVPCVRIDTERFPFDLELAFEVGGRKAVPRTTYGTCHSSFECGHAWRSIWYRRVRTPVCPASMDAGVFEFCMRESRAALVGSLLTFEGKIMSPPASVWRAEFKPLQLAAASAAGFCVPESIVTNSPDRISEFYDGGRRALVIKPVRAGYFELDGEPRVIYTNRLLDEHVSSLETARFAPSIYQEFVPKVMDIRVTYVAGRCYAAAIYSQSDAAAAVDWRRTQDENLPHSRHALPQMLEELVCRYMHSLGLHFGALDFALAPDGRYYFLEVNPNGQWLWIDQLLELGITDAVANWLAR